MKWTPIPNREPSVAAAILHTRQIHVFATDDGDTENATDILNVFVFDTRG